MAKVEFLSRRAIDDLRSDHERLRLQVQQLQMMVRALSAGSDEMPLVIGYTDGSGLTARSTTTPGSGTVTIHRMAAGGTALASTGYDVTCYNMDDDAVAASTYVEMVQDSFGRYWSIQAGDPGTHPKQFCRFAAGSAFTTSSSSVTGSIDSQWGSGTDHTTTTGVTFNNMLTNTASTYLFEGDSGDHGIATYSGTGTTWNIIQMECP